MSNSTGLSAVTTARLRKDLTLLAHNRVFPVVVETALYAIFTILIAASTYLIIKRGLRYSWANRLMLFATLAMYTLSTLDWAIDIRLLWNDLQTLRVLGIPGVKRPPFGYSSPPLLVLQGITSVICIIIGDAVVCWRVCVVWANRRWMIATALFWVIGSIGVFTTWSVMFVGFYYPVPESIQVLVDHSEILNAFAFSWSAATNVWATAMIAYKAWKQRQNLRRHLHTSAGSAVQKILVFLVDLGVIYTIFMLLNVVVLAPSLTNSTFFYYVTLFMQQITGMYPTAVIVLVALQKSQLDHHFTYPSCPTSHSHSGLEGASLPFSARTGTLGATYASSSSTELPSLAHAGRTRAHGQEPGVKARARAEAQVIALLDVKRSMTNTTNVTGARDSVWETTEDKDGECEEGFGLAK